MDGGVDFGSLLLAKDSSILLLVVQVFFENIFERVLTTKYTKMGARSQELTTNPAGADRWIRGGG